MSGPKRTLPPHPTQTPSPLTAPRSLTNFNVAISIVSLFTLLGKMITTIMKVYYPLLGLVLSLTLTALYAVSVYGQLGPDHLDPRYPSSIPWFIKNSCDIAKPYGRAAVGNCMMAKGTLAATVFMLALYAANVGLAVWAMCPNPELDIPDEDEEEEWGRGKGVEMEMQPQPLASPRGVPFTPRTQAFHTLDRKLPLRGQYR